MVITSKIGESKSDFNSAAHRGRRLSTGALVFLIASVGCETDALAGNPFGSFVGGVVGGVIGGVIGGMGGQRHRNYYAAPQRSTRNTAAPAASPNDTVSAEDSSRILAGLSPPTTRDQQVILKAISAGPSLGAVGAVDDLEQIGKDNNSEDERDYSAKVEALIARIKAQQGQGYSGDVTEHAILESLDNAIRNSGLLKFETFLGEDWSPERLRVMILVGADAGINSLFDGTSKNFAMHDVDSLIRESTRNVYSHLFETSELLAANRGATLFVQRLYQTHGELVSDEMRDSAEQFLEQVSFSGVAAFEPLLRRDANSYALRYRAQRIIFDCLSDNVEAISSSESGVAATAEMGKRVLDVTQQQCSKWVSAQLIGPDGKVKTQEPLPLRVVWTPDGPKDDDSMYGHAADQL